MCVCSVCVMMYGVRVMCVYDVCGDVPCNLVIVISDALVQCVLPPGTGGVSVKKQQ